MKSRSSSQSHSGRRGSSRPRGGQNGRYTPERVGAAKSTQPSLWQKIVSLFTGNKPSKVPGRPAARLSPTPVGSTTAPIERGEARGTSSSRTARKPEAVEVTSPRLYVGNLSFDATESDLTELFNGVGKVASAEVVSHKQTQRSKGFAFVQMQSIEEAKRAVNELHDKEFMNRKLVVSGAKNSDEHSERGSESRSDV